MAKAAKEPKPKGRPSDYTAELGQEICRRLSEGEPLAVICRDDGFPCDDTVRNWAAADEAFSRDIARAREIGHDAIAYRLRATARGKTEGEGGDSSGDVQRDKLIIETDLKLLAKWNPKRYGDKVALVGGDPAQGDNPLTVINQHMTAKEAAEAYADMMRGGS